MIAEQSDVVKSSSTPRLHEFDPTKVPFQFRVLNYIRKEHDYDQGVATILLSGSVGSAKSILAAHIVVTHALMYPGAGVLVLRRTLGDLKATIWKVILSHYPELRQYWNKQEMTITLPNGSLIIGKSYDDGDYEKFRSYELSMVLIEEAIECEDKELYDQLMERLERLPHIHENIFLLVTNPDSPLHWIYRTIIQSNSPLVKVFYSLTEENPFLKPSYIRNLLATLDPRRALRMLKGMWVEITGESIYYNYDSARNFKRDQSYVFHPGHPICLMHDFNIGHGKPMSAAVGQFINGTWHIAKTFIVDGFKTRQIIEEIGEAGIFECKVPFYVFGDRNGRNNDTRGNASDYDIIEDYLSKYQREDGSYLEYSIEVPNENPPLKRRWKYTNLKFMNALNEVNFFVYKEAADADEGFRLTKLKKGSALQEDDSYRNQHVTTAIGYAVDYQEENNVIGASKKSGAEFI